MVKEYLDNLNSLFNHINSKKINESNFEIKHFFSGAAIYVNGTICISLTPAGFAIKLPEELRCELMKEKGTKQLRYFSKGHIKKEYVVLPKKIMDDKTLLVQLIEKSFEYVTD